VNVLELSLLIWVGSIAAGMLGALTGLGGAIVIIPLLTLVCGVEIHYAAGAALVAVVATASGAALAYVRDGYSNLRVGMFLEMATSAGAVAGASVAARVPGPIVGLVFGIVLLTSAGLSLQRGTDASPDAPPDRLATWLNMDSTYPTPEGRQGYHVRRVPLAFAFMLIAGTLSGLLGIGSGALKVLALDRAMRLPFKVSTTTSNFMIGVTAAASAGVYLNRGYIDPGLAMPVMLGVLIGSLAGARLLPHAQGRTLRRLFAASMMALGLEMIHSSLTGGLV